MNGEPDIIATRKLTLVGSDSAAILVELGRPTPTGHGYEHECLCRITGVLEAFARSAYGIDAFQAIQLALEMIGSHLAWLEREHGFELRHEEEDYGFPTRSN